MPSLKDILSNSEEYPDDEEITVKGVKVKVGDLREYQKQESEATMAQVREQLAQMQAREQQLMQQAEDVAALQAQLQEQQGAQTGQKTLLEQLADLAKGPSKKTMMDLDSDEFFGPAVKTVREMAQAREALQKELADLRKQATDVISYFTRRQLQNDYAALGEKPPDVNLQKLVDHATKRQYRDEMGYPDLRRAYDDMTAPQRAKADRARLREEVKAEVAKEQAEARKNRAPSPDQAAEMRGHVFVPNGTGKSGAGAPQKRGGFGGVEKVPTEAILSDPDIAGVFNQ